MPLPIFTPSCIFTLQVTIVLQSTLEPARHNPSTSSLHPLQHPFNNPLPKADIYPQPFTIPRSPCIVTPPYTGPPPPGLTKTSDIDFWRAFIRSDNAIPNPVGVEDFLFYSGDDGLAENVTSLRECISQYYFRTVASWTRVYYLSKPLPPGSNDPLATVRSLFDSYLSDRKHGGTLNLHIMCLSWSLARPAAIRGGTVHLALWKETRFSSKTRSVVSTRQASSPAQIARSSVLCGTTLKGCRITVASRTYGRSQSTRESLCRSERSTRSSESLLRTKIRFLGHQGTTIPRTSLGAPSCWMTVRVPEERSREGGRLAPFKVCLSDFGGCASPGSSGWRWKGSIVLCEILEIGVWRQQRWFLSKFFSLEYMYPYVPNVDISILCSLFVTTHTYACLG